MGKINLRDVASFKISPSYRWDIEFLKYPNIDFVPEKGHINIRAESVDLPKEELIKTELNIRGYRANFPANRIQSGEINVILVETNDMDIRKFINAWREGTKNNEGISKSKEDLSAIIRLNRYDLEDNKTWHWDLYNAFISGFDDGGTLSPDSTEPLKISITISYDWFENGVE